MEHLIEEAFRVAILTEMNSYRTYKKAAAMMPDGSAKNVLERLAEEELLIIDELSKKWPYPVPRIQEQSDDQRGQSVKSSQKESPEHRLCKQLRAALVDRHCSIEKYMIFVTSFKEPAVCKVFELALGMSRRLFKLISEACTHAEMRLHRTGLDRRKKRTHIRPVERGPAPNKHTEAFISLLDSGRRTLF